MKIGINKDAIKETFGIGLNEEDKAKKHKDEINRIKRETELLKEKAKMEKVKKEYRKNKCEDEGGFDFGL